MAEVTLALDTARVRDAQGHEPYLLNAIHTHARGRIPDLPVNHEAADAAKPALEGQRAQTCVLPTTGLPVTRLQ